MRRTTALQNRLEAIGQTFLGRPVTVEFGDKPHAKPEGDTVVVDTNTGRFVGTTTLDGPNELRLIINTLNHEIAHVIETDLLAKKRISEDYTTSHGAGRFAGFVYNVLEDQYVDRWRTNKWRGLRLTQAFYVSVVMGNHIRRGRINTKDRIPAIIEGFFQTAFTGSPTGFEECETDIQHTLAWCRVQTTRYREEPNHSKREEIARNVIEHLLGVIEDVAAAEDYVKEMNAPVEPPTSFNNSGDNHIDAPESVEEPMAEEEVEIEVPEEKETTDAHRDFSGGPVSASEVDETEIEKALDEMRESDSSDQRWTDWYNISEDSDYSDPGEDMREEFERIRGEVDRGKTDLWAAIERRNERIGKDHRYQRVQQAISNRKLADEIEDVFYELKTRDVWVPSRYGNRIDIRRALRRLAGDQSVTHVHSRKQRSELGDRAIGVALDLSGSMDVFEAKVALGALYMAIEIIGDQLVVTGFKSISPGDSYRVPTCPLITAPVEEFEWEHLDAANKGGSTPTASGIYRCYELLEECVKPERVMFVITDGKPNITLRGDKNDDVAIEQAFNAVRDVRSTGTRVIGLGVGSSVNETLMAGLFGNNGYLMADSTNFAEDLIETYYSQMSLS